MNRELSGGVLKGVSRSFYLTLRMLPWPMRGPAGLAYLLARATDTVADSSLADGAMRVEVLERMRRCIQGGGADWVPVPGVILDGLADARERRLLERWDWLLYELAELDEPVASLIRELLETIISGQRMDIERFAGASAAVPVVFADENELDDYTWRVAGCVGAFWTKLGYAVLGDEFSLMPVEALEKRAVAYGKGLQMVNILRDLPHDIGQGRCYLPVADASDRNALMLEHQRHVIRSLAMVHQGLEYGECLMSRRLRAASVLPALIADETLELMRGVTWDHLARRIKVGRWSVYRLLLEAVCR